MIRALSNQNVRSLSTLPSSQEDYGPSRIPFEGS